MIISQHDSLNFNQIKGKKIGAFFETSFLTSKLRKWTKYILLK